MNNGSTVAEYESDGRPTVIAQALNDLPQTEPKDYVQTWCNTIAGIDDTGSSVSGAVPNANLRLSKESGIDDLDPYTSIELSEYATCKEESAATFDRRSSSAYSSINVLELNVYEADDRRAEVESDGGGDNRGSCGGSFAASGSAMTVSEVYRYTDRDEDVVLYERRVVRQSE